MMPSNPVPAWHGPRDRILGAPALVIAHTRDVAVSVTDVTAFPDGFSFDLDIRLRRLGTLTTNHPIGTRLTSRSGCTCTRRP